MIEIISPQGDFVYRQRPNDPRIVESRRNQPRARWEEIGRYETAELARAALLQIEAAWRRKAAEEDGK